VSGNELLLEIVAPRDETSDKLHWRSVFEPGTLTQHGCPSLPDRLDDRRDTCRSPRNSTRWNYADLLMTVV
jgi:hypothetical protein